jgi:kynurenine formamidase
VTESTLRGLQLARGGRVIPLGQPFWEGMPQLADSVDVHHTRRFARQAFLSALPNLDSDPRVASEWVEMSSHSGTHIDALGHWSTRGQQFGGAAVEANWSPAGLAELGLEQCPPIVTRGVLLDVAAGRGVPSLQRGELIDAAELEAAMHRSGVSLVSGDVALVRTGWARLWDAPTEYMGGAPGLTRAAASWLADQQVVAVGADTWVVDAVPPERPHENRAVHETCLVERGVYLIENLNLEALSAERIGAVLFICLAPRFVGGTGFPVMPVAVV